MKRSDYHCKDCKNIFEVFVNNNLDNFPINPTCSVCGGINTKRKFTNILFDVAEGKAGNSKNQYQSGFVDHPSSLVGKVKGVKV